MKKETFIFDLLLAYGTPKATIARLQKDGGLNLTKVEDELLWKKKLYFRPVLKKEDLPSLEEMKQIGKKTKHEPRFLIQTDYQTLLAVDQTTSDSLEIPLIDLPKHFDFFLPLAGMEKAKHQNENPADVKAAEKMARLYDELSKINTIKTKEETHNLNVFLSRLLFCFFAEDTNIFQPSQFTNAISSHTQEDGSDLHTYLDALFLILNTEVRKTQANYLKDFPYVNGGLFRNNFSAPHFNKRSRLLLIECGELDWSAINPDIFGSMMQAVVSEKERDGMGMHYTSVPNIMKVIEPLFLTELYEEFASAKSNTKKLMALLERLWKIKIFDPACGSGNFLIIAYKELRILEMKIFGKLNYHGFSKISLSNFYGIELDDFAHEIAMLSLWLAEHQMNQRFLQVFKTVKPALPLTSTGNIVQGNACRLDWETVCPKGKEDEIYILGNPPYVGARMQDEKQKSDMKQVFHEKLEGYNDLDYIASWFFKGANFIRNHNAKCAFVSTNSISQGSQVSNLWPNILKENIEIGFVHQSFKWINNAKSNAAVSVIILGMRNEDSKPKIIFKNSIRNIVKNISPYLTDTESKYIFARRDTLSNVPSMNFGSMPNDGGHLILSKEEYNIIAEHYPSSLIFFKRFMGSHEFLNNIERWCIWIDDNNLKEALRFEFIRERIAKVKKHRLASNRGATNNLANVSHCFAEIRFKKTMSIIVPANSSERRTYLPIGFLNDNTVISNLANAVYSAEYWVFSMITSKMHMTWVRTVAGRLKTDFRYSNSLCYNTFPFPKISDKQKKELETHVYRILEERERHSEKTLAQLYDPDKMPEGLREAHHQNDLAIERCYRSKPFTSDEERLEYLFQLYEKMVAEEKKANGK
nr:DNA methyltransferase [Leptospira wolbachii]